MLPTMINPEWSTMKRLMFLKQTSGSAPAEDTATGNPLVFTTDLARPLKSLLIPFTPQQEGTGDPSPSNIRSILPWNGLKVFGGGKNLFDTNTVYSDTSKFTINGNAVTGTAGNFANTKLYIPSEFVGKKLTFSAKITTGADTTYLRTRANIGGTVTNGNHIASGTTGVSAVTFIPSADTDYIYFGFGNGRNGENVVAEIQLEVGETATAYEPYHPITETDISFPYPVYGGEHEAVSGKLMSNWKPWSVSEQTGWTMSGNEIYRVTPDVSATDGYAVQCVCESAVSMSREELYAHRNDSNIFAIAVNNNYLRVVARENGENIFATLDDWKAYIAENPLTIVYQFATPQEITLTPEQITALIGNNTIWSYADGSMTAVYLKKK